MPSVASVDHCDNLFGMQSIPSHYVKSGFSKGNSTTDQVGFVAGTDAAGAEVGNAFVHSNNHDMRVNGNGHSDSNDKGTVTNNYHNGNATTNAMMDFNALLSQRDPQMLPPTSVRHDISNINGMQKPGLNTTTNTTISGTPGSIPPSTKSEVVAQLRKEHKILMVHLRQLRSDQKDTTLTRASRHVHLLEQCKYSNSRVFKGHNNRVIDMEVSAKNGLMVSCSSDGHSILWETGGGNKVDFINLHSLWTMCCAMSEDSRLVAFGGLENSVSVYATYNASMDYTGSSNNNNNINVQRSNLTTRNTNKYHALLTTAAQKGNFDRDPLVKLKGHKAYVSEMEFLDRQQLLSASGDYSIKLWDTLHQKIVANYTEHCGQVSSVQCHPRNRLIFLTSSSDGTIKIWDARMNKSAMTIQAHHADIVSTRFVTERCGIASAAEDGTIRIYDLRSDSPVESYSWLVPGNSFSHQTPLGEFTTTDTNDFTDAVLERQPLGSFLSDYRSNYADYKRRKQTKEMEDSILMMQGSTRSTGNAYDYNNGNDHVHGLKENYSIGNNNHNDQQPKDYDFGDYRTTGRRHSSVGSDSRAYNQLGSASGASPRAPQRRRSRQAVPELAVSFIANPSVKHLTVLASSSSHRLLFLGYDDGTICVLDILKGQWISQFQAHSDRVSHLSVADNILYSSSFDGTIKNWVLDRRLR